MRKKQHFCFVFRMPVTRKKLSRGFSNDRISRPQQIDRSHKHCTRRLQFQCNCLFYKPLIIHNLFFYFFNRSYKTARSPMIFNSKTPKIFSVVTNKSAAKVLLFSDMCKDFVKKCIILRIFVLSCYIGYIWCVGATWWQQCPCLGQSLVQGHSIWLYGQDMMLFFYSPESDSGL